MTKLNTKLTASVRRAKGNVAADAAATGDAPPFPAEEALPTTDAMTNSPAVVTPVVVADTTSAASSTHHSSRPTPLAVWPD